MDNAALGQAVEVTVLEQRDDGSGLIEIPILPVSEIDMSRTTGGGKGKVNIRTEELDQIVSNFNAFGGPVPVGFLGHNDDRSGPQPAFVEALKRKGDMLWAGLELNAWAFAMVVGERAFRAFSVEIQRDLKTATTEFEGWVLTGGTFTNRPATEVNFKVAAEGEADSQASAVATIPIRSRAEDEVIMPEDKSSAKQAENVSVSFHNEKVNSIKAELETASGTVATLEARVESLKTDAAKYKADAVELSAQVESLTVERDTARSAGARAEIQLKGLREQNTSLNTTLAENQAKLGEAEAENLDIWVTGKVNDAVAAGAAPAYFDGHEANPGEWMLGMFSSKEAFEKYIGTIRGVGAKLGSGPVKSGHDPAKAADPKDETPEEHRAVLSRLGLDKVDYSGVTNVAEARARLEAAKADK